MEITILLHLGSLKTRKYGFIMDKGELQQFNTPQNIANDHKTPFIKALIKNGGM